VAGNKTDPLNMFGNTGGSIFDDDSGGLFGGPKEDKKEDKKEETRPTKQPQKDPVSNIFGEDESDESGLFGSKQSSGTVFEVEKEAPAETMDEKKKRVAKTLGQPVLPTADGNFSKEKDNKKSNIFGDDYEDESGLFTPSEKKDKQEKKGSIFAEDDDLIFSGAPKSPSVTKETEEPKKDFLAEPEESPTEKMKKRMAKLGKNMFAPDLTQEFKKKSEKMEHREVTKEQPKQEQPKQEQPKQEQPKQEQPKAKDSKPNNLANIFSTDDEDSLFPSEKSTTKKESEKTLAAPPKTDTLFSLTPAPSTKKKRSSIFIWR